MKKTIFIVILVLMLNIPMVLAPEGKAEKLRHEGGDWDRDGQQFVVRVSCKFGIATAGEHAGFTVRTELTIEAGGKTYTEKGVSGIVKVARAEKDPDGYIAIEPSMIAWDRQGFTGDAGVTTSLQLVSPSGNSLGDSISTTYTVRIEPPGTAGGGDDSTP